MVPSSAMLEAYLASATTFAATWFALRLASGSAVLVALGAPGAAPAAPEAPAELVVPPELAALLHAASARQLVPTATDAIWTKARRPWNISSPIRAFIYRANCRRTQRSLNDFGGNRANSGRGADRLARAPHPGYWIPCPSRGRRCRRFRRCRC